MSEQQNIKTEKPTWTYPSSRQTPTAYNNPASLEWVVDVPNGKMPAGFVLDAKLTTVGAGMTLARISQIFKSIKVFADGKLAVDIDQHSLDLVPIVCGWAKHADDYADTTIGQLATGAVIVKDDVNVATGASMYGYWNIQVPIRARRQLRFVIETYDMTTPFGSGMTGGVPSISVVPKWANAGKRKQYNLYARQLSSVLRASYRGVEIGAFFNANEWNSISNGLKLGGDLSVEQISAIESNVGNHMSLWTEVIGAAVDGRLTTIQDPNTGANTYVLANKFDGQTVAELSFTSAQTIQAIVLSEAGPDSIEVQ